MSQKNSNIKYPEVRLRDVAGMIWEGIKKYKLSMFVTIFGLISANVFLLLFLYITKSFLIFYHCQEKKVI